MSKKLFLSLLMMFLIMSSFWSCYKKGNTDSDTIYTAVLKLDGGCAKKYACIITSDNIDPSLVQSNWSYQGNIYQNAFSVKNGCSFGKIALNQTFSFKIINHSQNTCAVCEIAILGLPNKELAIQIIS